VRTGGGRNNLSPTLSLSLFIKWLNEEAILEVKSTVNVCTSTIKVISHLIRFYSSYFRPRSQRLYKINPTGLQKKGYEEED